MRRRMLDVALAGLALVLLSPVIGVGALAVRASGPGPVLYRAPRVGRNSREFTMLKLRTMRVGSAAGGAITSARDPRVSPAGAVLRRVKIDELPQLVNVLKGDMAIVGPRPEDPRIVAAHYRPEHMETLLVRPGLASPGSIFNYTHGEAMLDGPDAESSYRERLLPLKLALEVVYVRRASLRYDLALMLRTAAVLVAVAAGRRRFPPPPEMREAEALLARWRQPSGPEGVPVLEGELVDVPGDVVQVHP
ncbi:MAG TPA: sugar transferase [Candidatus Dormibacteraeota bacterium]|nr:sugar transferase [Candidatus Dormibacteraeota bacterium]